MEKFSLLEHIEVNQLVDLALLEDGIGNDLTTLASGLSHRDEKTVRATILAKSDSIAAGSPMVDKILAAASCSERVKRSVLVKEGEPLKKGTPWIFLEGPAFDILRIERVTLNFLMRMCGIAQTTASVVRLLEGTQCKLLHTRKTLPGHRRTDVYAALVGGAHPHRRSLDDAILVKENHLRATASFQTLADGIEKLRGKAAFVEIEVTNFVELKHAMAIKPNRIMLDNFTVEDVAKAVQIFGSSVLFEASGGINPGNVRAYADTGVDFISMGFITHSAPSADLSMLF